MHSLFTGLFLIPLALACHPVQAQSSSHTVVKAMSNTPHGTRLAKPKATYRNAKGHTISQAEFAKAMKNGQHFGMKPSADGKRITITLLPAGSSGGIDPSNMPKPNIAIGGAMPPFELPTLGGGKANPASLAGATTLVDLFFAECVGCIEELPALNAYAAAHPNMHFLAITFDDAKTAKSFVDKRHFNWPVAYNGSDYLDKRLKVHSYPTLFLLDARGRLLAMRSGSLPIQTIKVMDAHAAAAKGVLPDAAVNKKAQLKWLDQWVGQHMASSTLSQRP